MDFREFFKHRRIQLRLTQTELAKRITRSGYSVTNVSLSYWERGRNKPHLEIPYVREAVAAALEMDLKEMMIQLGYGNLDTQRSPAALLAANIIDSLSPIAQDAAVEQLRALEKYFAAKQPAQTE